MSKKTTRFQKRLVNKERDKIIRSFMAAVYTWPFKERFKFAWSIMWRKYS